MTEPGEQNTNDIQEKLNTAAVGILTQETLEKMANQADPGGILSQARDRVKRSTEELLRSATKVEPPVIENPREKLEKL